MEGRMEMKKFIVIVILLIATNGYAGDWTRNDTYRELAFTGLLAVDYLQTRTIAHSPDKYFEYNPIEGKHPNQQTVDMYHASVAILHPIISYLLPPRSDKWKYLNRENWQYVTIGIEVLSVANNFRIGIMF